MLQSSQGLGLNLTLHIFISFFNDNIYIIIFFIKSEIKPDNYNIYVDVTKLD